MRASNLLRVATFVLSATVLGAAQPARRPASLVVIGGTVVTAEW